MTMIHKRGQVGFTLTEMLVVMAILAILFGVGLQAAKMIMASFESGANVRHVISAALVNARALAMKEGTYVGVRFQADRDGRQYMTLIQHDYEMTGLANGFRAVNDRKPTPLPENVIVMDTQIRYAQPVAVAGDPAASDLNLDESFELTDATTFSVVFNKAGRLVTHDVRVMVRDICYVPPPNEPDYNASTDDIFNTINNVMINGIGRFIQDGVNDASYTNLGLGQEPSRTCFIVAGRSAFEAIDPATRWSRFLQYEPIRYVNPFSGEIVNQEHRP